MANNKEKKECEAAKKALEASQKVWDQFVDSLLGAIDRAMEKGEPARLLLDGADQQVTIDIYSDPSQRQVLDDSFKKLGEAMKNGDVVLNKAPTAEEKSKAH